MTPKDKLEVLCDAFRENNPTELRLKLHSLIKATRHIIEHASPLLKTIPGIDSSQISNLEVNSKLINFELSKLNDYVKNLESLRDTPKSIVLIDDDPIQGVFWKERCELKGIRFSHYSNHCDFIKNVKSHSKSEMIVIDWYLNNEMTGDQVAKELASPEYGFNNLYITSSVEIDASAYKGLALGYVSKNPSWL